MLENITGRFDSIFGVLRRNSRLTEKNIRDGIREIKLALLEADVNYRVVKDFIALLEAEAIDEKVLKSVTPTEQFIKIVHDKLIYIMGDTATAGTLSLKKTGLSVILLVGLQGSGKTTTSAKLAYFLKGSRRPLLVSVDTYRPAAREQLEIMAKQAAIDFFSDGKTPIDICDNALAYASTEGYHVLIIDTAGRLSLDEPLMRELEIIKKKTDPIEILFVSDSMAGQSIVKVAKDFDSRIGITGLILSKFDSDARGGAALSLRQTTGKPIKFIGLGEKIENLEPFHADRIAGRILGKGDIVSFVEKISRAADEKEVIKTKKKLLKNKFDMEDFLVQIRQMRNMGSLKSLVSMLPLAKNIKADDLDLEDKKLLHTEAIILSMTKKERRNVRILDANRRRRIARGSGRSIQEVNRLLKQFNSMQKMMKRFRKNPGSLQSIVGQDIVGNIKKLKI